MQKIILLITLFFSLSSCATQKPTALPLNQIMSKMAGIVTELLPKVLDKTQYEKAVAEGEIKKSVTQLSQHIEQATPYFADRSDTFKISLDLIKEHLKETQSAIEQNKLTHSRNRLMVLGEICASCHTQDTKLRTLFTGAKREKFASDFAFAEYNFVTRNYPQALPFYEKHLSKTGEKSTRSLGRILAVHTQINADPKKGIKHLKKIKEFPTLSKVERHNIDDWIIGLNNLQQDLNTQTSVKDFAKLRQYVVKYLGNIDEVPLNLAMDSKLIPARYWLRGQLFHYLNTEATKEQVPELLYWLSACDRSLDYNLYYSLADLYLKDCMNNFSKHKVAKSCFREYQDYMEFSYSGSAGTHIPEHLKQELEKLRRRIWIGID